MTRAWKALGLCVSGRGRAGWEADGCCSAPQGSQEACSLVPLCPTQDGKGEGELRDAEGSQARSDTSGGFLLQSLEEPYAGGPDTHSSKGESEATSVPGSRGPRAITVLWCLLPHAFALLVSKSYLHLHWL